MLIKANELTDVGASVADLRVKCERSGISPVLTELLATQARKTLDQLVEHAKQLSATGSQMSATRELNGEGYSVKFEFRTARAGRSFFERVIDTLRGR
jgi:hypothetical protein